MLSSKLSHLIYIDKLKTVPAHSDQMFYLHFMYRTSCDTFLYNFIHGLHTYTYSLAYIFNSIVSDELINMAFTRKKLRHIRLKDFRASAFARIISPKNPTIDRQIPQAWATKIFLKWLSFKDFSDLRSETIYALII